MALTFPAVGAVPPVLTDALPGDGVAGSAVFACALVATVDAPAALRARCIITSKLVHHYKGGKFHHKC